MILFRLLVSAALITGALRADSLEQILRRMDENAKNFRSVSANLRELSYNAVIQDTTTQTGQLRLRRGKNGVMGVVRFNPPDDHTIAFNGRKVEIYNPKANQVQEYDVGKRSSQLDQFIWLAFGASGGDLQKNYNLKAAGSETIEGTACSHLELTPKSAEVQKFATKIELWIPEGKSNAIREKVTEPSNDYVLTTYSDIKQNPPLPDSDFELKLPAGVHVVKAK